MSGLVSKVFRSALVSVAGAAVAVVLAGGGSPASAAAECDMHWMVCGTPASAAQATAAQTTAGDECPEDMHWRGGTCVPAATPAAGTASEGDDPAPVCPTDMHWRNGACVPAAPGDMHW